MLKIKNLRWLIVGLLFVATALSFLDRQVLSISILKIQADLNVSDVQYGWVNTGFLISYALMFTLGGWLIDKFGTRIGLAVSVGLWSLSNALHGAVQNVWQLGTARFFLGIGEGGCFPGAAKGVTEWFPQKHRALAMGIAIGGAALGAVVASLLNFNFWMEGGFCCHRNIWKYMGAGMADLFPQTPEVTLHYKKRTCAY